MGNFVGPHNISGNYGWFHVYAFTMLVGMIAAILASWVKLHRRKIPTDSLISSVLFIIPASLFGASFFGKNDPKIAPSQEIGFWAKFSFWKEGMSIHGGVLFGVIVGIIFFSLVSRKTKISMPVYGDCIIPNILLGQVIGRWGNFFNHELLGRVVGTSSKMGDASGIPALSWLPAFIRDNSFRLNGGSQETNALGEYVFRQPIFLYESLANLTFWILLTAILPILIKAISKNKPWKINKEKYKLLTIADIKKIEFKNGNLKFLKKFTLINFIHAIIHNLNLKHQYWKQAFYDYRPNDLLIDNINKSYNNSTNKIYHDYWKRSKDFYYAYNPDKYFVMRSGVQMWLYFFGWNLIRFCLELLREDDQLFLINRRTLDHIVLISIFVIGLVFAIICQFVFARYFRSNGWTYEKEYMAGIKKW